MALDLARNTNDTGELTALQAEHDARFLIQKCREDGSQEGSKYLFFDYGPEGSWQYREYCEQPKGECMLPDLEEE